MEGPMKEKVRCPWSLLRLFKILLRVQVISTGEAHQTVLRRPFLFILVIVLHLHSISVHAHFSEFYHNANLRSMSLHVPPHVCMFTFCSVGLEVW